MQTTTLTLFRFGSPAARAWALWMMGEARLWLPRLDGIRFWKLFGSGTGEGFTPIPNTSVWGILATWTDPDRARRHVETAELFRRYRRRASESWSVFLSATSARGQWSGQTPFEAAAPTSDGPIAALTRATLKPTVAFRFWNRVPDISDVIGSDPNVALKVGLGEVPLLHQVTFSIWPDADSMARFARRDGPHADAIRAVREGLWFREELYARFRIMDDVGLWQGRRPLAGLETTT